MLLNIKGIDINYEIYGEGEETLLILHGWMGSIPAMAPIWKYFMNNRKVVVLDFPGQGGKSGKLVEPWGVPEYSEMVRSFMEELKLDKPDVIGHSFGGRVIIYLASKYQDIFNKIILTDAAGIKPKMTIKRFIKRASVKISKAIIKLLYSNEKREEKLGKLRNKFASSDYAALDTDVMRGTFNKIVTLNLKDNLKNIKSPTLLIWGDKDTATPLYMAKIMEKEIKDSGLVVLEGAGHFSYLDQSSRYNIIVENFLGGNE